MPPDLDRTHDDLADLLAHWDEAQPLSSTPREPLHTPDEWDARRDAGDEDILNELWCEGHPVPEHLCGAAVAMRRLGYSLDEVDAAMGDLSRWGSAHNTRHIRSEDVDAVESALPDAPIADWMPFEGEPCRLVDAADRATA